MVFPAERQTDRRDEASSKITATALKSSINKLPLVLYLHTYCIVYSPLNIQRNM
jgi:hypothetical protein